MVSCVPEWSWVTVLTTGILVTLFVKLLQRFRRRRNYKLPPGPKGFPLLGTFGSVDHVTLWNHRDRFGDVSYVNVLGTDIVVLNSLEVIRDALQGQKTAEVFSGRPHSFLQQYFKYEDVILRSINAENWKPLRHILHSSLKQYGEGIVALEVVVCEELEVLIGSLYEKVGRTIDISEQLAWSVVNILCILLIGERFEHSSWQLKTIRESMSLQNQLGQPFSDLMLRSFPFIRFLPFGLGKLIKKAYRTQQTLLSFLYRDFKRLSSDELDGHSGITFELMREQRKARWLKDTNIEGLIQDIMAAGYVTTDASIRVFLLLLLHYPHVQERLQAEIDEVVGHNRRPHLTNRDNMPYTMATILELFRYASIVSLSLPHLSTVDTIFHGQTIPRDSVILLNLFRIHHDPEVWTDPWVFDPTRFLDDSGNLLPSSHYLRQNLLPFSVGKRLCMGENFAKTRLFLFITYFLQSFNVRKSGEIPSCDPRTFSSGIALLIPHYTLRIQRRK